MDNLQELINGYIDFKGQALAELMVHVFIVITAILSFIIGFGFQNINYSVYAFGGGVALTTILVLPPWPIYNQDPPKWLPKAKKS